MKSKLEFCKRLITSKKFSNKKLILSVVALFEIIAIIAVSTSAWVETISSIIIEGSGNIDTYTYTVANISEGSNTAIDLAGYFREAGGAHLASASSADGKNFYFPITASANSTTGYRQGGINDKNVNYVEFSFKIAVEDATKFYFNSAPTITADGTEIPDNALRVSITANGNTNIYSDTGVNDTVVSGTDATTSATETKAFSDYAVGNTSGNSVFSLSDGTTEVTVAMWLQDTEGKYDGKTIEMNDFKIVTGESVTVSFRDRTTANNGSDNGLYWVENHSAKMWFYNFSTGFLVEMTQDQTDKTLWTAEVRSGSFKSSQLVYFYRTSGDTTSNPQTDYWNYWSTTVAAASDANSQRFTAYGTKDSSSGSGFGTWDDVVEIDIDQTQNNASTTALAMSTSGDVTLTADGEAIQMYYNTDNQLYMCFIPAGSKKSMEFSNSTCTVDAVEGYESQDANTFVVTSASTGYWVPGTTVTIEASLADADTGDYPSLTASLSAGTSASTNVDVGLTVAGSQSDAKTASLTVTQGTTIAFSGSSDSNNKYQLIGFYTDSACTNEISGNYSVGSSDVTIYAKYQRQYTVKVIAVTDGVSNSSTGGTVKVADQTAGASCEAYVLSGGSATITAAKKDGYNFNGWFTTADGTSSEYIIASVAIDDIKEDITLYAQFAIQTFTVTAKVQSGTAAGNTVQFTNPTSTSAGTEVSVTVDYNGSATFKATADSDSGYEFVGWYTSSDCSGTAESTSATYAKSSITSDYTLYAKFQLKSYTVKAIAVTDGTASSSTGGTVALGSGTGAATASTSVEHGSSVSFTASANSGYTFDGWYSNSSCTTQITSSTSGYSVSGNTITVTATAAATVYAKFTSSSVTTTIYIDSNIEFTTYSVWVYNKSNNSVNYCSNQTWPGDTASYDSSTGYYKYTFNTSDTGSFYIILSNSGSNQTDKLEGTIGGTYWFMKDATSLSTTEPASTTRTLYFTNNNSWSSVYCYAWVGSTSNANWPGVAMTYYTTNSQSQSIYKITISSDYTYVIFSDGSSQTVDIELSDSYNAYYLTGDKNGNKYEVAGYNYTGS